MPALKRVGHKGADHVAPGNTRESFEAALEHGVDMIEFDVLRLRDGRLVLAHDYGDAAKRTPLTLDEVAGTTRPGGAAYYAAVTASRVAPAIDAAAFGFREFTRNFVQKGVTFSGRGIGILYRAQLDAGAALSAP